jgi:chromosome partitioning protein
MSIPAGAAPASPRFGRTIVFAAANHKGGVSKTTSSIHLAGIFALLFKLRVLVIDGDPQRNATRWFVDTDEVRYTIRDALRYLNDNPVPVEQLIVETRIPGLDLIPSNPVLTNLKRELSTLRRSEDRIKLDVIEPIQALDRYDIIIVDLPPDLGDLPLAVVVAADFVLVPVDARVLGLEGVADVIDWVDALREEEGITRARIVGLLVTKFDIRNNVSKDVLLVLVENLPEHTMRAVVWDRIGFEYMVSDKLVAGDQHPVPGGKTKRGHLADASHYYLDAATELLARAGLPVHEILANVGLDAAELLDRADQGHQTLVARIRRELGVPQPSTAN